MNGDQLAQVARKTEHSFTAKLFSYFDSYYRETKAEECAKLYILAAQAYKLETRYHEAANMFVKASILYKKFDSHQQIENLNEAFNLFAIFDLELAYQCVKVIIEICLQNGEFIKLIRYKYASANILKKMGKYQEAIEELESIIEACKTTPRTKDFEGKSFNALFDLYLETGNYPLAAKTLERYVAANESKIMILKNQESIFNAAFCRLASEPSSDVEIFLNKHFDDGLINETDRRYQFLLTVIVTVQEGDEGSFTEAVRSFDSASRLKPWQIKILLLAKEKYFTQLDPDLC